MIRNNRKKNQQGFTLVEVIVVAVIVAAMAAVAVPMYLGYVENSRANAASNAAGAVASFLGSCTNSGGEPDDLAVVSDAAEGPIKVTCVLDPVPAAGAPAINIPDKITVTRAAAGTAVTAFHADAPAAVSQPYSY